MTAKRAPDRRDLWDAVGHWVTVGICVVGLWFAALALG